MNRKLIIHLCIIVAMLCVAALIWNGMGEPKTEPTEAEWELATKEDRIVEDQILGEKKIEDWKAEGPTQAGKMMVGIVLLIVVASYGGIVFVAYLLPSVVHPENRFPWVEMAKIHRHNLENPEASIKTLREALESYQWRMNDAAFFMFRLAELHEEDKQDLATATGILQQVVDTFPDTRHAANATHRLRELGAL
jgi:hypothetical protein